MKDKDVKKMLSDGARQVLPDDGVKRDIRYRLSIDGEEKTVALSGGAAVKGRVKTPFIIAAVFAVVAALLCAILIPYYMGKGNSLLPDSIDKFATIDSADDFYVYGAASVGALLSAQSDGGETAAGGTSAVKSKLAASSTTTADITAVLDEYMSFVEGLLGGGEITSQTQAATDGNYSGYEYSVIIGYPHMDGGYSTYTLYYNRTNQRSKTDGGETEEKHDIEGVLCVDGTDYYVDGKYESEKESGETEEEITFTVYENEQPYITLKQESEQEADESELGYLYTFYSDGKAVKSVEVEYEQEDGETEVKLTVNENGSEYEFEFTLVSDTTLKVTAEVNGSKYKITVTITDGKYYYTVK